MALPSSEPREGRVRGPGLARIAPALALRYEWAHTTTPRRGNAIMQDSTIKETRPLSPHLQIYRPMLTMMMSIAHRISGAALATGFVLLAWWLLAISAGPAPFAVVNRFFASVPGQMLLFLYSWALLHHMLGGIRHLIWDTGRGLDRVSIEIFAWATTVGSTTLNLLLWLAGYWLKGSA